MNRNSRIQFKKILSMLKSFVGISHLPKYPLLGQINISANIYMDKLGKKLIYEKRSRLSKVYRPTFASKRFPMGYLIEQRC